jgi:hypothetical protein
VVAAQLRGLGLRLWLRERRRRERVKALVAVGVAAARPRVAGAPDASRVAACTLVAMTCAMVSLVWSSESTRMCGVHRPGVQMAPDVVRWTRGGGAAGDAVVSVDSSGHVEAWRFRSDTLRRVPIGSGELDPVELAQLRHELGEVQWETGSLGACPHGPCETLSTGFGSRPKAIRMDRSLRPSTSGVAFPSGPAFDHMEAIYERYAGHDVGEGR